MPPNHLPIMRIIINKPDAFVKHSNEIGIQVIPSNNKNMVNFWDEYGDHKLVRLEDCTYPHDVELKNELLLNQGLRQLALDNDLINIDHDSDNLLNLIISYA